MKKLWKGKETKKKKLWIIELNIYNHINKKQKVRPSPISD